MHARRMSPRWLAAAALLALVLVPAGVAAGERMGRRQATATLRDTRGVAVGQVRLEDRGGGRTRVRVRAWGLSPGYHGFHIHAVGVCDPDAVDPATGRVTPFFSAGGHHNPAATSHPAHGGDLPARPGTAPTWSRPPGCSTCLPNGSRPRPPPAGRG